MPPGSQNGGARRESGEVMMTPVAQRQRSPGPLLPSL